MKTKLTSRIGAIAFAGLAFVFLNASAQAQTQKWQVQAETKRCVECHEDETKSYEHSIHRKAWGAVQGLENKNCSTCHGNADEHIRTEGKAPMLGFTKRAGADPEQLSKTCLTCHSSNSHIALWKTSTHAKNGVTCASCHSMHKGPLEQKPTTETCLQCHKETKLKISKFSHHPIVEGKVSCKDCHNPHGSTTKGMLLAESINQTCYKCHADKRGPYLWEHAPVEENCATCHEPHGTNNSMLLVERQPYLCQRCHDSTNHPGTLFSPVTAQLNSRFIGRSCTNCHSKIHGSYAPANPNPTSGTGGYNSGNHLVH